MIERGNHPCLAFETLTEPLGRDFDCNFAVQSSVCCTVDFAHTAGGEERFDAVRPQRLSWPERSRCIDQLRRCRDGPRLVLRVPIVVCKQRENLTLQLGIAAASLAHVGITLGRIMLQRLLKDLLNLLQPFHTWPSRRHPVPDAARLEQNSS